jgi:hypothetical protein
MFGRVLKIFAISFFASQGLAFYLGFIIGQLLRWKGLNPLDFPFVLIIRLVDLIALLFPLFFTFWYFRLRKK